MTIIIVTLFLNFSEIYILFGRNATKGQQQSGSVCGDLGFAFPVPDLPHTYCSPVGSYLVLCPSALPTGHFSPFKLCLHLTFHLNGLVHYFISSFL